MRCPKCKSDRISVQAVTDTKLKDKHHGFFWWVCIGWWWIPFKWIFLTLPALIVKIFVPKRQKLVQKHVSMCVCQSCGYNWKA